MTRSRAEAVEYAHNEPNDAPGDCVVDVPGVGALVAATRHDAALLRGYLLAEGLKGVEKSGRHAAGALDVLKDDAEGAAGASEDSADDVDDDDTDDGEAVEEPAEPAPPVKRGPGRPRKATGA